MDSNMPHDMTSQSSTSGSGSAVSGLSLLDNDTDTDDFGREMLEHARADADQKRLQQAIHGGGLRAFRKARPLSRRRTSLTAESLERRTLLDSSPQRDEQSPLHQRSVSESEFSNQPNVPRRWGSKGVQRNAFLRRLSSLTPNEEDRQEPNDPDKIYKRRTILTGDSPRSDIDWTPAAADIPLPSVEQPSPSPQRPKTHDGSTFGAPRSSSLDLILQSERKTYSIHPAIESRSGREKEYYSAESQSKDGEGNAGGLDIADQNSAQEQKGYLKDSSVEPTQLRLGSDYEHRASGSRDLLRRLARASSSSPSPRTKDVEDGTARVPISKITGVSKQGKVRSSLSSNRSVSTSSEDDTRTSQFASFTPKTPVVTGAWVDTPMTKPLPQVEQAAKRAEADTSSAPSLAKPEYKHPRSALEAVLRDTKKNTSEEVTFNESTIDSLKELIEQDIDLTTILPLDDDTLALVQNVGLPVNQAQRDRQQEILALQRMNERLRSARNGLRDASRSMKRVEDGVEEIDKLYRQSVCSQCGCPHTAVTLFGLVTDSFRSITSPFVIWTRGGRPKLTWLGLTILVAAVWFVLESFFCIYLYYNPYYSDSLSDWLASFAYYDDEVEGPRVPFITMTMILRPFTWDWIYIMKALVWLTWGFYRVLRHSVFSLLGQGEAEQIALGVDATAFYLRLFGPDEEVVAAAAAAAAAASPYVGLAIGQDEYL